MNRLPYMGHLSIIAAQVQLLYLLGASKSQCKVEGYGQIGSMCTKLAAKEEIGCQGRNQPLFTLH